MSNIIKKSFKYLFILVSILTIISLQAITYEPNNVKVIINRIINKQEKDLIGKIIIPKLNINNNLYDINSYKNNVDMNVTILKESTPPSTENSIMILAAHSGNGEIAYFKKLDELKINDEIILIYDKKKYTYIVKEYWEEKKNGYININKEEKKQLVLTTCSPKKNNFQFIVNCTEK